MKDVNLLGFKVKDIVTGFEGIVETVAYDLYGCIQAIVRPAILKDKPTEGPDGRWFDVKRLVMVSDVPVMSVPAFVDVPGPTDKPAQPSDPTR